MKAILEFTLPEEAEEHMVTLLAGALRAALTDLDRELRHAAKYQEADAEAEAAQKWRNRLWEIAKERGLEDLL